MNSPEEDVFFFTCNFLSVCVFLITSWLPVTSDLLLSCRAECLISIKHHEAAFSVIRPQAAVDPPNQQLQ